jgi:aminopeptidase N
MLRLPTEQQLAYGQPIIEVDRLHTERNACAADISRQHREALRGLYRRLSEDAEAADNDGARLLQNTCLWFLMKAPGAEDLESCRRQAVSGTNFESIWAASRLLVDRGGDDRVRTLAATYDRWRSTPPLLDHWFMLQAASDCDDCAELVARLPAHVDFSLADAARVKALLDTFTANQHAFHDRSGRGYQCVAGAVIMLNDCNPRLAARFLGKFGALSRLDAARKESLGASLRRIRELPGLAPQLQEIADKCLDPVAA